MLLRRQPVIVAFVIVAASLTASAQQKDKPRATPRTAWGDPDLQGTWTNETITPFERPVSMASKPFLTSVEAADLEARAARQRETSDDAPPRPGDVGSYNQAWFDSGTKVVSTLQSSLVVDPPDGRVPLRPEAPGRRILLADDNVDFATSLGELLSARGHNVRIAHDGAEALREAEQFHPEVAFVDIGMPKVHGYEVARRMRAAPGTARTLLVAVTGWGQENDRRRAREAGFDRHLVKPVDPQEIEAILEGR